MGRFTNPVLVAAGTALIVVGVAAQTGTVNLGARSGSDHAAIAGDRAAGTPKASASPLPAATTRPSPPAAAPAAPPQGGGAGGGSDGGDGGD